MFGAVIPIDKMAIRVQNTTVIISPMVKGFPELSFLTSSPINFLP